MTQRRWFQIGGIAGLVFVVLIWAVVLWVPVTIATPEPPFDGPAQDWLAYARATHLYAASAARVPIGIIAMLSFMLFAVTLSVRLRMPDRRPSVPSTLVVLGTGLTLGLWLAGTGVDRALSFRAADLDASTASLMYGLDNGLFVTSWFAMGSLLIAAGVGGLTSGALPGWLSWSAPLIGCAFVVAGAFPLTPMWLGPYLLFYVWVVAVSVGLIRNGAIDPGAS